MRYSLVFIALFLSFHSVNSQVSIEQEPSWIVTENYNPQAKVPEDGVNSGTHILLYSNQVQIDLEESYTKSVSKATEYSGIQNISSVVAEYDPSYQKLRFHKVEVVRNGTTINKLKFEEIQTARRETNAENFIYDGTISAFINIPDVRIGDIVRYSYSIKGFNPIQKGKYSTQFTLNTTETVDKLSVHLFGKKELNYQMINSDLAVKHNVTNGVHHYEWSDEKVKALVLEEATPMWYIEHAMVLVSEYKTWEEVIDWGKDIFTFNEPLNNELQTLVKQIKTAHPNEGARINAALDFVQNEVRYLAVNSGIGGYKPNSPNTVIVQRFGDCKDKSVLLAAILNAMDIKAYPTLVNTALQQSLLKLAPSSNLFDHCIVKVIDKHETTLWYDPTLTDQSGTYTNRYMPDYRYGLVLDSNLSEMDTISDFRSNLVEAFSTYTLNEMGKGAELLVRTNYYDGEADYMRSIFRNNNKALIEKELLNYYANLYGVVSVKTPPVVADDSLKNEFSLFEHYTLDSIWRPSTENTNKLTLTIIPTNIMSVLEMPTLMERTTPYALSYPMARKHNIIIKLPERISSPPEYFNINSDFFYYDFNSKYNSSENLLTLDFYYKNQTDHIDPSRYAEYYKEMGRLDQNSAYLIMVNKNNTPIKDPNFMKNLSTLLIYGLSAVLVLGLIVGIIVYVMRKKNP